jgi:hypothetical protein
MTTVSFPPASNFAAHHCMIHTRSGVPLVLRAYDLRARDVFEITCIYDMTAYGRDIEFVAEAIRRQFELNYYSKVIFRPPGNNVDATVKDRYVLVLSVIPRKAKGPYEGLAIFQLTRDRLLELIKLLDIQLPQYYEYVFV